MNRARNRANRKREPRQTSCAETSCSYWRIPLAAIFYEGRETTESNSEFLAFGLGSFAGGRGLSFGLGCRNRKMSVFQRNILFDFFNTDLRTRGAALGRLFH